MLNNKNSQSIFATREVPASLVPISYNIWRKNLHGRYKLPPPLPHQKDLLQNRNIAPHLIDLSFTKLKSNFLEVLINHKQLS